jgi:hypothetical protein
VSIAPEWSSNFRAFTIAIEKPPCLDQTARATARSRATRILERAER